MGITPDEFWGKPDDIYTGLTLAEFDALARGYQKRMQDMQELLAWHAANTMSMHAKKGTRITPDKLLGRNKDRATETNLVEQIKARKAEKEKRQDLSRDLNRVRDVDVDALTEDDNSFIASVLARMDDETGTVDDDE